MSLVNQFWLSGVKTLLWVYKYVQSSALGVSDKHHAKPRLPSSAARSCCKVFSTHFTEVSAGTADATQSLVTAQLICWHHYKSTGITRASGTHTVQSTPLSVPNGLTYNLFTPLTASCSSADGWGTALQARRSEGRFPMGSVRFFIALIFTITAWPWDRLRL
jgi:hypothetical protein